VFLASPFYSRIFLYRETIFGPMKSWILANSDAGSYQNSWRNNALRNKILNLVCIFQDKVNHLNCKPHAWLKSKLDLFRSSHWTLNLCYGQDWKFCVCFPNKVKSLHTNRVFVFSNNLLNVNYPSWVGSLEISQGFKFNRDVCLSFATRP